MMTRSLRADLGVMISASHNAFSDNGIKLFGPDGYKLSDERELEIEALMDEGLQEGLAAPDATSAACSGSTTPRPATSRSPRRPSRAASAWRACAWSSIAPTAPPTRSRPTALYELGAEVIRDRRRAQRLQHQRRVRLDPSGGHGRRRCKEYRADIGIALDGDADRLVICDEQGQIVDGDQIMALIAGRLGARATGCAAAAWWRP